MGGRESQRRKGVLCLADIFMLCYTECEMGAVTAGLLYIVSSLSTRYREHQGLWSVFFVHGDVTCAVLIPCILCLDFFMVNCAIAVGTTGDVELFASTLM